MVRLADLVSTEAAFKFSTLKADSADTLSDWLENIIGGLKLREAALASLPAVKKFTTIIGPDVAEQIAYQTVLLDIAYQLLHRDVASAAAAPAKKGLGRKVDLFGRTVSAKALLESLTDAWSTIEIGNHSALKLRWNALHAGIQEIVEGLVVELGVAKGAKALDQFERIVGLLEKLHPAGPAGLEDLSIAV